MGQAKVEEIKIVKPAADKAAGKVTVPGAFWNSHSADWVEVALCGRPSDFLHETVLSVTTTRALLEQAMREVGFHDGDGWADSVNDFPRVRGDRFMVLVEFTRDGKPETFSLDELMEFEAWGVSMGPFGFMFRGDPDRASKTVTQTAPGANELSVTDATRILRDDPQIAVQFKGLQNVSQSFADHPLAYDNWEFENINWSRNYAVLPPAVFDSNGTIPLTISLIKMNEEQFLTRSARVWHDPACAENILRQLPIAKQIDAEKTEFWALRQQAAELKKTPPELRDAEKELAVFGRLTLLEAMIDKNYAALDAAWTTWSVDHLKTETDDLKLSTALKRQAQRWQEHMSLEKERTSQLAAAEDAAFEKRKLLLHAATPADAAAIRAQAAALGVKELGARSLALLASNKQAADKWLAEKARLDPKTDSRETWITEVDLHVQLTAARDAAAHAGIAIAEASSADGERLASLNAAYQEATRQVALIEERLNLANVEFELSKRDGDLADDPQVPALKKQREEILRRIKEIESAPR